MPVFHLFNSYLFVLISVYFHLFIFNDFYLFIFIFICFYWFLFIFIFIYFSFKCAVLMYLIHVFNVAAVLMDESATLFRCIFLQ